MRFITGVIIALVAIECPALTKIACIGNSITYGANLSDPSSQSFPGRLQKMLGTSNYSVQNDGVSATTLSKNGDNPYWRNGKLPQVFAFQPNIITIKLGTNDTKPQNWENLGSGTQYKRDYLALVDTLAAMPSHPKIYLVLPVPVFSNPTAVSWGIRDSIIQKEIPIIKDVAAARPLTVIIDANAPLKNFPQFFKTDGVHPDSSGQDTIAHVVYRALTAPVKLAVPGPSRELMAGTNPSIIKTSLEKITFQLNLSGKIKEITVYDCSGHLLRKLATVKQNVSLTRDFGLSRGVYIIKTSVSRSNQI